MNPDKVVCNCMGVTIGMIEEAIDAGARSFDEVQAATQAGTVCGACEDDVERVVQAILEEKKLK